MEFPLLSPTGLVEGGKWPAANMAVMSTSLPKAKVAWQDSNCRYSLNSDAACKELGRDYVIVSKGRASRIVKEYNDSDYSKTKTYVLAIRDNIIVVRFSTNSSMEYNAHIGESEKSVETLQVYKAVDIKTTIRTMSAMQSMQSKVARSGAQVIVKIDTTSSLAKTPFRLTFWAKKAQGASRKFQ